MATKTSILDRERLNLRKPLEKVFEEYFASLEGEVPQNLYSTVTVEVEKLLLDFVILREGSQRKAFKVLGLSLSSIRKKVALYKNELLES